LNIPRLIILVGLLIGLSLLLKAWLDRIRIPPLVGWLVLGFLVQILGRKYGFLDGGSEEILGFLAKLGIITLLFKVGLESKLVGLVRQLGKAVPIWVGSVVIAGLAGYFTSRYFLGLDEIPSLVIGIAMTATSVGVPIKTWEDTDNLDTKEGQVLLDAAEMDDISGVILMAFLFSVLPVLHSGGADSIAALLGKTSLLFIVKIAAFGALCFLFARYLEKPVTTYIRKLESGPDPMLTVASIGFIIAAVAAMLGFSVAIGAFFAGLAFSRDPEAVKLDISFNSIYELFTPFFFIGIGLVARVDNVGAVMGIGLILFVAAVVGKLLGTGLPALTSTGVPVATLLGISMIPRAEITMIIMERGMALGDWAVTQKIFSGMVIVSALTCILAPIVIRLQLRKLQLNKEGET